MHTYAPRCICFSFNSWRIQCTTFDVHKKKNNLVSFYCLGFECIYPVTLPLVPFLKNLRFCVSLTKLLFKLANLCLLMFTCIVVTLISQYSMLVYNTFPHPHFCKKHKSRKISRTWIINNRTEHK